MMAQLSMVRLGDEHDKFKWGAHKTGVFSVRSMYASLMNTPNINHNVWLWKLKLPLKIKIFLWYLGRGVTLTKDNLLKRRWKGSAKCSFCNQHETIQHLFFDCYIAKALWRIIFIALNIRTPSSVNHIIGSWQNGKGVQHKRRLLVGVAAMFWSIWLCRTDAVFNNKHIPSILQVTLRGTHWFRFWRLLRQEKTHQVITDACRSLKVVAMELFATHGWRFHARIGIT